MCTPVAPILYDNLSTPRYSVQPRLHSLTCWLVPCAYLCLTSPVDQSTKLSVCFCSLHVASSVSLKHRHGIFLITTCHRRWTAALRVCSQAQKLVACQLRSSAGSCNRQPSGRCDSRLLDTVPCWLELSEARCSKEEALGPWGRPSCQAPIASPAPASEPPHDDQVPRQRPVWSSQLGPPAVQSRQVRSKPGVGEGCCRGPPRVTHPRLPQPSVTPPVGQPDREELLLRAQGQDRYACTVVMGG